MVIDDPKAVVEAFRAAARDGDEEAALALCTEAARALGEDDGPVNLFAELAEGEMDLVPFGAGHVQGDRAAIECTVLEKGADAPVDRLWLLMAREGGGFKLTQVWQSTPAVALYLGGAIQAHRYWESLPESPEGRSWAEAFLAEVKAAGDDLDEEGTLGYARSLVRELLDVGEAGLLGAWRGPAAGSVVVAYEATDAEFDEVVRQWIVLDERPEGLEVRAATAGDPLEELIETMDVPWPGDEPVGGATPPAGVPDLDEIKDVFEQAVGAAMKELEGGGDGGPGDEVRNKVPDLVMGLFNTVLEQARAQQGLNEGRKSAPEPELLPFPDRDEAAPPAEAPAEAEPAEPAKDEEGDNLFDLEAERRRRGPREPSPFERKVQDGLRSALEDYVSDNVEAAESGEVKVDTRFLQQHGPALLGNLFKALAESLVPDEIKVDVPAKPKRQPEAPAADDAPPEAPPKPEAADEAASESEGDAEAEGAPRKVAVKLDFSRLFEDVAKKITEAVPKNPPKQPEDES